MLREIVEAKMVKYDVSQLVNNWSDGPEQEFDDLYYLMDSLKQHGMKDSEWSYVGEDVIEFPAKYVRYTKGWMIDEVK